jgi:hypothetical protein
MSKVDPVAIITIDSTTTRSDRVVSSSPARMGPAAGHLGNRLDSDRAQGHRIPPRFRVQGPVGYYLLLAPSGQIGPFLGGPALGP